MKKSILFILAILFACNLVKAQEGSNSTNPADKKELKPALLVIDVQNAYLASMDQSDKEQAIQSINWAIWLFEKYELPIIRIYHQSKEWGPAEDSEEFKFTDEVKLKDDYPMVIKHYGNAFTKTDLDSILKEKEINALFLCGLSATGCVMSTYVGSKDHDYKTFLIKNALLSPNADHTDVMENIMSTMDLESIMFLFEHAL
jgi:nicotinamidase-related amidase